MPKIIKDEFTDMPVSRQRKWQLRVMARGLCALCGKRPLFLNERCQECIPPSTSRYNSKRKRKEGDSSIIPEFYSTANKEILKKAYQKMKDLDWSLADLQRQLMIKYPQVPGTCVHVLTGGRYKKKSEDLYCGLIKSLLALE